jgi:hypothetical protein
MPKNSPLLNFSVSEFQLFSVLYDSLVSTIDGDLRAGSLGKDWSA